MAFFIKRIVSAAIVSLLLLAPQASSQERIVQGTPAAEGSWDSTVALMYKSGGQKRVFCSGSLVAPQWVLTAAHCSPPGFSSIYARQTYDIQSSSNEYLVDRVVSHPKAIKAIKARNINIFLRYDIALLRLRSSAEASPIALQSPGFASELVSPWTLASVSGWGLMRGKQRPMLLQEAEIPILSRKYCSKRDSLYMHSNMICAGWPAGGSGVCYGDSGGPLTSTDPGSRVLIGVTSRGTRRICGGKNTLGVFIRVSRFYDWIQSVISG